MLGYRETLRRLTINDPRFLDSMFGADPPVAGAVDAREMALMRFASLVPVSRPVFFHAGHKAQRLKLTDALFSGSTRI